MIQNFEQNYDVVLCAHLIAPMPSVKGEGMEIGIKVGFKVTSEVAQPISIDTLQN